MKDLPPPNCLEGIVYFLLFLVPVAVLEDPVDIIHFAGGSINLTCTVFGDWNLEVVWFKNGTLISDDPFPTINDDIIEENPNGITVQSFLSITYLDPSDEADYFCQGSNPDVFDVVFQISSASAHVTVQG